ncbi:antigen WC1.1-like [Phaenicophaeus curvirostris]|uniref:antigen WC1.1-like n=1 Tax=Phaenicophaeus curvirostris TaxID=33595 RepID=UPI0037F0CA8D
MGLAAGGRSPSPLCRLQVRPHSPPPSSPSASINDSGLSLHVGGFFTCSNTCSLSIGAPWPGHQCPQSPLGPVARPHMKKKELPLPPTSCTRWLSHSQVGPAGTAVAPCGAIGPVAGGQVLAERETTSFLPRHLPCATTRGWGPATCTHHGHPGAASTTVSPPGISPRRGEQPEAAFGDPRRRRWVLGCLGSSPGSGWGDAGEARSVLPAWAQVIGGRGAGSGEITPLITAQKVLPPPLAPACLYITPRRWVRRGTMEPLGVLGLLLLCLRLCRGAEDLRLVDGGGRCAGRVEVKHEGEWGSVCNYDFDWEARWAGVVCRQLGCGAVAKASAFAPFGRGTGRIWLQPVICRGVETTLQACPHFGWGKHFCGHDLDVGVTCTDAVELRLAGGGGPCAGRVEVKLRGRWGSVADSNWDAEDAEVVCQQLGCGSAAGAYLASARFGPGDGPIGLAIIDCRGDEAALWDCEVRGWGPYSGIHDYDTAVVCQGFTRLVGGDGACAGRLEVRRGRAWVGVCEDAVDVEAARVVCRELGCGVALAGPGEGWFEEPTWASSSLWEGGFECDGTESRLAACARRPPRNQSCAGHASITCSPYAGFRLVGSGSSCAGRVEVEAGGTWGSLCATGWDLPDAHVLCRHLGCGPAAAVPPGGSFGAGNAPLRPDNLGCVGNERHPGECPRTVLGEPGCTPGHAAAVTCSGVAEPLRLVEGETRCDGRLEITTSPGSWSRVPAGSWDARGAGVVCRQLGCGVLEDTYTTLGSGTAELHGLWCNGTEENVAQCNISGTATVPTGSPEEVAIVCSGSRRVRLVGGPGRCAGRVEVYVKGSWSSVCANTWDALDAAVVCRQLGCGTALEAPDSARFGVGTKPPWPVALGCAGTEDSLWDCPPLEWGGCQRGGRAGAVCSELLSLRLAGGGGRCRGHLELLHEGTWGRVCANGTGQATAAAVCRQLSCGHGGSLVATPSSGSAPAWLAWLSCGDDARSLWQCRSAPWRLQPCALGEDAYITCDEDGGGGASGTPSPDPVGTGFPGGTIPAASVRSVPVPVVLSVVLGSLLCLALGALVTQTCRARARHRGAGEAADAIADAVYEELDYIPAPEYQEVPSRVGSLSEGSVMKLQIYAGDSVEEGDPEAEPGRIPALGSGDASRHWGQFQVGSPGLSAGSSPGQGLYQ